MNDRLTRTLRGNARAIDAASRRAADRFAELMTDEAEVAYAGMDSPVGRLVLASSRRGLIRVQWLGTGPDEETEDDILAEVARKVSPRILHAPARLDEARRELDEYFAGDRTRFEVPVDWSIIEGFRRRVLQATARIPFGSVATYTDMAKRAGSPRAMRAAGNALGSNPVPIVVPCHRVLRTGGGLGGYGGGLFRKRILLEVEGVL
jgi:methylated-DNA-[protein]-cysteine S-methyltransferase